VKHWFASILTACACSVGFAGEIVLRSGAVVDAPVLSVGLDGVQIGGDAPRLLGWDVVYYATGEGAEQVHEYHEWSTSVWRAKSRLSRGDLRLASELFEDLFARLQEESIAGPTGLVIAEGTLRCRVGKGRHSDAIEAWAASLRIRETGQRQSGESGAGGVIDPQTLLVPTLPPMWLEGSPEAVKVYERLGGDEPLDNANALLDLYRVCAGIEIGLESESVLRGGRFGQGHQIVDTIIRSRNQESQVRSAAQSQLLTLIQEQPGTWKEAWARMAIGRSYLLESDPGVRSRGVLHLLHLPARFANSQPHLAALALAEAGRELHTQGDRDTVELIRSELRSRYARHAAVDWLDTVISQ